MNESHVCKRDEEGKIHVRQAFMFDWSRWITYSIIAVGLIYWAAIIVFEIIPKKPSNEIQFRDNKIYMIPKEKIYSS